MIPINLVQAVYALCMGGSEELARQIVVGLNASGSYACSVYAVDHGGPMAAVLAREGVPYHVFSRKGKLDVKLIRRMAARFRADKIQVVHTHHLCQLVHAGIAGRLAGARIVHTEHEFYALKRVRDRRRLRLLSKLTDVVTAVAEPVAAFLHDQVGIASAKIRTIPNAVDIDRYHLAGPLNRSSLGCKDHDVIIGCVARLEPEKGHAVLVDAFHRVHEGFPHVRLLLIGDGGQRESLIAKVAALGLNGAVQFLGIRNDIPEVLATCDLVVLPSLQEGLPMILLEAMAAGKVVVTSKVGAIPDVVQDSRSGILVPPANIASLAEALSFLIKDQSKRQEMGAEAYRVVQGRYSYDRMLQTYDALYQSVLSGRKD